MAKIKRESFTLALVCQSVLAPDFSGASYTVRELTWPDKRLSRPGGLWHLGKRPLLSPRHLERRRHS